MFENNNNIHVYIMGAGEDSTQLSKDLQMLSKIF